MVEFLCRMGTFAALWPAGRRRFKWGERMAAFNGLGLHLGNLSRLSDAKTRSISAENPTGEPGMGRSQQRLGLHRWHIMDPVRFQSRPRVTIQAPGWRPDRDLLEVS
jgi:hypothetical protein